MFSENLVQMRKLLSMTQEDVAEKVGVTRQAVAKWESGESVPDLEKSKLLAEALGVSLDELVNHEPEDNLGLGLAPKGKHLFGIVTVGDKGQIVIPAKARKLFNGCALPVTEVFLERMGRSSAPADWSGIWTMTTK